jgi:8-oxo-dGTP pyrophosphatase MutT (NUDIX family)
MKHNAMNGIPDNFYRTSVKALIFDNEHRLLFIQESNGLWEMPGGGLDYGEKPQDCLAREIREEMGLETVYISQQPLYFASALNIDGHWKTGIFYEIKLKNLDFTPSEECVRIKFFTKEEALQKKLYPIIREFLTVYKENNQ